jgi:hypothetical protein
MTISRINPHRLPHWPKSFAHTKDVIRFRWVTNMRRGSAGSKNGLLYAVIEGHEFRCTRLGSGAYGERRWPSSFS